MDVLIHTNLYRVKFYTIIIWTERLQSAAPLYRVLCQWRIFKIFWKGVLIFFPFIKSNIQYLNLTKFEFSNVFRKILNFLRTFSIIRKINSNFEECSVDSLMNWIFSKRIYWFSPNIQLRLTPKNMRLHCIALNGIYTYIYILYLTLSCLSLFIYSNILICVYRTGCCHATSLLYK